MAASAEPRLPRGRTEANTENVQFTRTLDLQGPSAQRELIPRTMAYAAASTRQSCSSPPVHTVSP